MYRSMKHLSGNLRRLRKGLSKRVRRLRKAMAAGVLVSGVILAAFLLAKLPASMRLGPLFALTTLEPSPGAIGDDRTTTGQPDSRGQTVPTPSAIFQGPRTTPEPGIR